MTIKKFIDCISEDCRGEVVKSISKISENQDEPLINSDKKGIDFDEFTENYFKKRKLDIVPKSNDAIIVYNNMDYFVEFKDSKGKNIKKRDIMAKIRDSLLLYLDILDEKPSYARENLGYILVYNPYKSESDSGSYKKFYRGVGELSSPNRTRDKFNLKECEGLYFKEVICFTPSEFEKEIERLEDID